MRPRQKPLDIHVRMPVVRSLEAIEKAVEEEDDKASIKEEVGAVKIRKLNIPTCSVSEDPDYEKHIKSDYVLPQTYVKHCKKLPGEADVTIDYVTEVDDQEWMDKHPKLAPDKEVQRYLDKTAFEKIIDILELGTGHSKTMIPVPHAETLVCQQLRWSQQLTAKVVPEVYKHWHKKRERLNKPLCRRYWPQTSVSDSNPHHVFRPRDKERVYRLRKQHRKNDVEGFRRMQQLRKEFGRARELLQLVVEREKLKLAELDVRGEIFAQLLYDMNPTLAPASSLSKDADGKASEGAAEGAGKDSGTAPVSADKPDLLVPIPRMKKPWRYKLEYEELLLRDEAEDQDVSGLKFTLPLKAPHQKNPSLYAQPHKKKIGTGGGVSSMSHMGSSSSMLANNRNRKRVMDQRMDPQDVARSNLPPPPERVIHPVSDILQLRKGLNMPGPSMDCRPAWPAFLSQLQSRENVPVPRSMTTYLEDLEFRQDSAGAAVLPTQYRCRGRMGRGGRLVIDRIPMYAAPSEQPARIQAATLIAIEEGIGLGRRESLVPPPVTYIYPTYPREFIAPRGMWPGSQAAMKAATAAAWSAGGTAAHAEVKPSGEGASSRMDVAVPSSSTSASGTISSAAVAGGASDNNNTSSGHPPASAVEAGAAENLGATNAASSAPPLSSSGAAGVSATTENKEALAATTTTTTTTTTATTTTTTTTAAAGAGVETTDTSTSSSSAAPSGPPSNTPRSASQRDGEKDKPQRPAITYTAPHMPALLPPRRGSVYSMLSTREMDIYAWSDSDDEHVEFVDAKALTDEVSDQSGAGEGPVKFTLRA